MLFLRTVESRFGAVVELDPLAQLQGPHRRVVVAVERLEQVGRVSLAVLGGHDQEVVDRTGDDHARRGQLGVGEAEATGGLGLEGIGHLAAVDDLLRVDAILGRTGGAAVLATSRIRPRSAPRPMRQPLFLDGRRGPSREKPTTERPSESWWPPPGPEWQHGGPGPRTDQDCEAGTVDANAYQVPRDSSTPLSTVGRSVMIPSTPRSSRRCISAGSSMVHTCTWTPRACAASTKRRVTISTRR